jgi:hypothetical protein
MIEIGKLLPNLTAPAETTGATEMLAFKVVPFPQLRANAPYFIAENAVGTSN